MALPEGEEEIELYRYGFWRSKNSSSPLALVLARRRSLLLFLLLLLLRSIATCVSVCVHECVWVGVCVSFLFGEGRLGVLYVAELKLKSNRND